MPKVFISHAAADKALINDLRAMLQGTIALQPGEDLFYSSGPGTGVPAGKNFIEYIRHEMEGSTFVIAVITPSFLASAFCLAELGAVWLAAEDKSFFPVSLSIDRGDLDATLTGIHVARLDERPPLAQLLKRVSDHFGRDFNAEAADDQISTFTAILPTRVKNLASPDLVPKAELDAARAEIERLGEEITAARDEADRQHRRAEEILAARTAEEARKHANAVPEDIEEAVNQLLEDARDAVRKLPSVAADILPYELKDEYMPKPTDDGYDYEKLQLQIDEGLIVEDQEGLFLNEDFPVVSAALVAVRALQNYLKHLRPDQRTWFRDEFDVPPDLRTGKAFRTLLR